MGMGMGLLFFTHYRLLSAVGLWSQYVTTPSHGFFHVESDASGGAQRVQTILLHTKDRYHLEPRACASTFGSAPFLIYSHLVFLNLISMLQAHRALLVPALPPRVLSPSPKHRTSSHALSLVWMLHRLCPIGRSHGCCSTMSVLPSALPDFATLRFTTWPGPLWASSWPWS